MLYFFRYDNFKVTNDYASRKFLWAFPIYDDGVKKYTLSLCINEFYLTHLNITILPNDVTYWRNDIDDIQKLYTINNE